MPNSNDFSDAVPMSMGPLILKDSRISLPMPLKGPRRRLVNLNGNTRSPRDASPGIPWLPEELPQTAPRDFIRGGRIQDSIVKRLTRPGSISPTSFPATA